LTLGQKALAITGMASPFETAQEIYLALMDDTTAEAEIRAERKSLAREAYRNGNFAFELTSSTVNGQSFSGNNTMTKADRLKMLGAVVKMFDNGGLASKRVKPFF